MRDHTRGKEEISDLSGNRTHHFCIWSSVALPTEPPGPAMIKSWGREFDWFSAISLPGLKLSGKFMGHFSTLTYNAELIIWSIIHKIHPPLQGRCVTGDQSWDLQLTPWCSHGLSFTNGWSARYQRNGLSCSPSRSRLAEALKIAENWNEKEISPFERKMLIFRLKQSLHIAVFWIFTESKQTSNIARRPYRDQSRASIFMNQQAISPIGFMD